MIHSFPKMFAVMVVALLLTTLNSEAQIAIAELQYKNGIYYNKNKPYTGMVNLDDNCEECSPGSGRVEMKNGKLHGSYSYNDGHGFSTSGTYKDGKKHGEWTEENEDEEGGITVENYKDGVLQNSKTVQTVDYYKGQLAKCSGKKNEQCAAIMYQLGTAQYSQTKNTGGKNFSLATQTFQRLLKEYPESQYSSYAKQILTQIKIAAKIATLPPEKQQAAQIQLTIDSYKEQLAECSKKKNYQCDVIMYQLGTTYYGQAASTGKQDFSMAIQTFQQLLKEYPESQYSSYAKQMLTQIETIKP